MSGAASQACVAGGGAVGAALTAVLQYFTAAQCLLGEPWPYHVDVPPQTRFDFIVVGAGAAGSALAARLAQLDSISVLLVEAGEDPPQESIIPGYKFWMRNSHYDWNFTITADRSAGQALQGGRQLQSGGRMIGGTDALNDMIYARGFPKDYQDWAAGSEWDWDTVLQYFKKSQHLTDDHILRNPHLKHYHGTGGPIETASTTEPTKSVETFLKAFHELGFPIVTDMTNPHMLGAGRLLHTIRGGQRVTTATAMLNKVAKKGNILVLRDTLVTKVLVNDTTKTAYGVSVLKDGKTYEYYADREVIVSAGTFNTPKLLMLSGIGPKEHLKELGIEVVEDLPVGENLHDHAMVLHFLVADSNLCTSKNGENQIDLIKYLHNRSGPLSSPDMMGLYVSLSNSSDNKVPDFGIYPVCIPRRSGFKEGCMKVLNFKEYICDKIAEVNENHEVLSFAVVLLNPQSRGYVRLVSKDPLVHPNISVGVFNDPVDLIGYPEVIEIVNSIANTTIFRKKGAYVLDLGIKECENTTGHEAMTCQARAMGMPAWHSVGSAAMGRVLDTRLRVRGVSGLRVVDASVMPAVIRGNTNAPTVMIAERAFDLIKEDNLLVKTVPHTKMPRAYS